MENKYMKLASRVILFALMFTLKTLAQSSVVLTGSAQPPLPFNILPQPGFESRTTGWSVTSGTFTTTTITSEIARGKYSAKWTVPANTASGVILQSDNITMPTGVYNNSCYASILYRGNALTNGGLTLEAYDGTNILGTTAFADVTYYTPLRTAFFTCPTSGSLRLRIRTTSTSPNIPTAVFFDEAFLGALSGTDSTTVSGSGSSSDTSIARFSGITGRIIQNTPQVKIDSSGEIGSTLTLSSGSAGSYGFNVINTESSGTGSGDYTSYFASLTASATNGLSAAYGFKNTMNISAGSAASYIGFYSSIGQSGTHANDFYHIFLDDPGAINAGNYYGLYIAAVSSGTITGTNEAIHVVSGRTYLGGALRVTGLQTAGGVLYGTSTDVAVTAAGTTGKALISAGASAPAFGTDILGIATNTAASAGFKGEYIETLVASGAVAATTTFQDTGSIALTAGDWDVTAFCYFDKNGATLSDTEMCITPTSGNNSTGCSVGVNYAIYPYGVGIDGYNGVIPSYRVLLASPTTYYVKVKMNYTVATPNRACRLSARRMR